MSEIIDNLKHSEPNKFQEELAKTYFFKNTSKENHFTQSQVLPKNKKIKTILLAVIIPLSVLFIAAALIFTNKLEINVSIYPHTKAVSEENVYDNNAIYLSKDGEYNKDAIKAIMFYDNASGESGWGKDFINLSNETGSKKAVLGIDFAGPQDMAERLLCFNVKGKAGGEKFRICFKDSENNICRSKINQLENSWQPFVIDMEQAENFINIKNVTRIDIELNPGEEQNISRSAIYFRDMRFTKREGL